MLDMPAPEFGIDSDGYPTDESVALWENLHPFDLSTTAARQFLVHEFPNLIEQLPCCWCESVLHDNERTPGTHFVLKFATGGWSGAETIIDVILKQFSIWYYHTIWKRGGYYEFEIPNEGLTIG